MNDMPPGGFASLVHAANVAQAHVESKLDAIGLSVAKLSALRVLADSGGSLPLGQLAERLACVKSNITQLVDRLEADGLVARQADASDRRTRLAALTEAGRKAYKDGARVQGEAEHDLFGGFSSQEAHQLGVLMGKVQKANR